jgi:hypothetical protein
MEAWFVPHTHGNMLMMMMIIIIIINENVNVITNIAWKRVKSDLKS